MRVHPHGIGLGVGTSLLGVALDREQSVLPEAARVVECMSLSLLNLLVAGPLVHAFAVQWTVRRGLARRLFDALAVVTIHSGAYALVHRCMHRVACLRGIHDEHHKFKEVVMPSAANAVSTKEFLLAYMLPFGLAAYALRPDPSAFTTGIAVVSVFNLLVHSPHLRDARWPAGFVRPSEHLQHHARRTRHYAAPTWRWWT